MSQYNGLGLNNSLDFNIYIYIYIYISGATYQRFLSFLYSIIKLSRKVS